MICQLILNYLSHHARSVPSLYTLLAYIVVLSRDLRHVCCADLLYDK